MYFRRQFSVTAVIGKSVFGRSLHVKHCRKKDTVDHLGEAVAGPFDAIAIALLKAFSYVEIAIVVGRKNNPLS